MSHQLSTETRHAISFINRNPYALAIARAADSTPQAARWLHEYAVLDKGHAVLKNADWFEVAFQIRIKTWRPTRETRNTGIITDADGNEIGGYVNIDDDELDNLFTRL